jgi:hypothetical protein
MSSANASCFQKSVSSGVRFDKFRVALLISEHLRIQSGKVQDGG